MRRGDPRVVVISKHPIRPAVRRQQRFVAVDRVGNGAGMPGQLDQLKIERQMDAVALSAVVRDHSLERQIDFADHHPLAVFVEHSAHAADDVVDFRPVGVVGGQQLAVRRLSGLVSRVRQVIAKLVVLDDVPDHVDAKPIDAAIEPEPQHVEHGLLARRDFAS